MIDKQRIKHELATREMAKRDLKTFLHLKFERYNKAEF